MTTSTTGQLDQLEQIIEGKRGTESYYEIGKALESIRDAKLYKESYENFNIYVRQRWEMKHSAAYQHIAAAAVVDNLRERGFTIFPANEAQARELTQLLPDQQGEVWDQVLQAKGPITAKLIKHLVEAYLQEEREGDTPGEKQKKRSPKENADTITKRFQKAVAGVQDLIDALLDLGEEDLVTLYTQTNFGDQLFTSFNVEFQRIKCILRPIDEETETPKEEAPPKQCWEILEIASNASAEEARKARDKLVKLYHPDKFPDPEFKKLGEERTKQINTAYDEFIARFG